MLNVRFSPNNFNVYKKFIFSIKFLIEDKTITLKSNEANFRISTTIKKRSEKS